MVEEGVEQGSGLAGWRKEQIDIEYRPVGKKGIKAR
jgi:hypothetical protein